MDMIHEGTQVARHETAREQAHAAAQAHAQAGGEFLTVHELDQQWRPERRVGIG